METIRLVLGTVLLGTVPLGTVVLKGNIREPQETVPRIALVTSAVEAATFSSGIKNWQIGMGVILSAESKIGTTGMIWLGDLIEIQIDLITQVEVVETGLEIKVMPITLHETAPIEIAHVTAKSVIIHVMFYAIIMSVITLVIDLLVITHEIA